MSDITREPLVSDLPGIGDWANQATSSRESSPRQDSAILLHPYTGTQQIKHHPLSPSSPTPDYQSPVNSPESATYAETIESIEGWLHEVTQESLLTRYLNDTEQTHESRAVSWAMAGDNNTNARVCRQVMEHIDMVDTDFQHLVAASAVYCEADGNSGQGLPETTPLPSDFQLLSTPSNISGLNSEPKSACHSPNPSPPVMEMDEDYEDPDISLEGIKMA
ncbi:hypothetical protein MKZ38_004688 [Zalerion maritima]|uniref:Uncharacterized protein n=1 Tax=Zalerion maritima TaxID=339359 RepID=A0AAD5RM86_9PEZI|nr:hypothetical protein MKZ38_004688 [Zalerion maritima]